ncbi:hypothetical protein ABT294_48095 [Nonomuraea sp. NPDC000554]|uniref:hypothetical protein n=1 Tax=Nonomuraea sp. NPDC000554 TaxID=3154259 RepID=UPI00332B210F
MAAIPFFVAQPVHAATNPRTHYSLSYGTGEYTLKGNLIWYDRTVQVGASLKATEDNCAMAEYRFFHGSSQVGEAKRVSCSRTKGHGFRRQYDQPGGVTRVAVSLYQSNKNSDWTLLDSADCTRAGCR